MTTTDVPREITQQMLDLYAEGEGVTEAEAWDALTIGQTILRNRLEANQFGAERVEVFHRFTSEAHISVSVEGPRPGYRQGTVNWSAWGATEPERAKVYAEMIALAADLAATLQPQVPR